MSAIVSDSDGPGDAELQLWDSLYEARGVMYDGTGTVVAAGAASAGVAAASSE